MRIWNFDSAALNPPPRPPYNPLPRRIGGITGSLGFATVANLWGESQASREEKAEVFWGWVGQRGLRGRRGLRGASPVRYVCEAAALTVMNLI